MRQLPETAVIYKMSRRNAPALRVVSDESVLLELRDCFDGSVSHDIVDLSQVRPKYRNPCSGPIYVDGAEVGDAVAVEIEDIKVAPQGIAAYAEAEEMRGHKARPLRARVVPIAEGEIILSERVRVPVKPVVGTLGVAPPRGEVSTLDSGPHGGNLDLVGITTESIVYLPVFVPGALLAVGDLHAAQGEGEVNWSGIECAGTVQVKIRLVKDRGLARPRIETPDEILTVGLGRNLSEAIRIATRDMVNLLMSERGLSRFEAHALISATGDVHVGGPARACAALAIPKLVLANGFTLMETP